MKLSRTVAFVMMLLQTSAAYQVGHTDGTRTDTFKRAIEKSTHNKVQPLASSVAEAIPLDQGPPDYWFHPKIHTFGNTGLLGGLHAFVAPFATKLIDVLAYSGASVREQIAQDLYHQVDKKEGARVLDLCCGVGISTRALQKSFHDAEVVIGVDTSPEMIAMAQMYSDPKSLPSKVVSFATKMLKLANGHDSTGDKRENTSRCPPTFIMGNAERTCFQDDSFDLVTIMYAFHEAPFWGRDSMLSEARRLLPDGATLAVIDISPSYEPSATMLAGEPYVLEYQAHIQAQLRATEGFAFEGYREAVPGHVGLWLLTRDKRNTYKPPLTANAAIPFLAKMGY